MISSSCAIFRSINVAKAVGAISSEGCLVFSCFVQRQFFLFIGADIRRQTRWRIFRRHCHWRPQNQHRILPLTYWRHLYVIMTSVSDVITTSLRLQLTSILHCYSWKSCLLLFKPTYSILYSTLTVELYCRKSCFLSIIYTLMWAWCFLWSFVIAVFRPICEIDGCYYLNSHMLFHKQNLYLGIFDSVCNPFVDRICCDLSTHSSACIICKLSYLFFKAPSLLKVTQIYGIIDWLI